jgi:UPF0755 protein
MSSRRRTLVALTVLVLLAGLTITAFDFISRDAMARPNAIGEPLLFTVKAGSDLAQVARDLERADLVSHHAYFEWRARWTGVSTALQAGTYEVLPRDSAAEVLAKLVHGRTKTFTITFIEGTRFSDLRRLLDADAHVTHQYAQRSDDEIMGALGMPGQAAEGQFFPSTYHFKANTSDLALLKRAYVRMQKQLASTWPRRAAQLPYNSPYEVLIMASIVEKETARADERPAIAGVFVRRLARGMKLQTDPTVIYGMGKTYSGNLRRADLERDTPYNTYTRGGLPPTPIAMPGAAALEAAVMPAPGNALYFVARGDGSHQFSSSLSEHDAAVRKFQLRGQP